MEFFSDSKILMVMKFLSVLLPVGISIVESSTTQVGELAGDMAVDPHPAEEGLVPFRDTESHGLWGIICGFCSGREIKKLRETSAGMVSIVDRVRRPFVHKLSDHAPPFPISRFLRAARASSEVDLTFFGTPDEYQRVVDYLRQVHQSSVPFKRMKLVSDRSGLDTQIEFTMNFSSELFPADFAIDAEGSFTKTEMDILECIMRNALRIHSVKFKAYDHIVSLMPFLEKVENIFMKTLPNRQSLKLIADWAQLRSDQPSGYSWIVSGINDAIIERVYFAEYAECFRWVTSVDDESLNIFIHQLNPKIFKVLSINSDNFEYLNNGDRIAEFTNLESIRITNVNLEILLSISPTVQHRIKKLHIELPVPEPMAHIALRFPNLTGLLVAIPDMYDSPLDLRFIDRLSKLRYLYASDAPRDVDDDDFEVLLPERLHVEEFNVYCLQPVHPVILTSPRVEVAQFLPGKIIFQGNTEVIIDTMAYESQLPLLKAALPPTIRRFTGPRDFYLETDSEDEVLLDFIPEFTENL